MSVRPRALAGLISLVSLLLVSCSGGAPATPTPAATTGAYSGIIGASEILVGESRIPFALVSRDGAQLEDAAVSVRFFAVAGEDETLITEAPATWRTIPDDTPHEHDDGEAHLHLDFRGVYVVDDARFPHPGIYLARFQATRDDVAVPTVETFFEVRATGTAPAPGEPVPATENPTIHDAASFSELSTRRVESDELHNVSVAQALDRGEPFVVFFASPQFCVSAMCGPVTDEMDRARAASGGVEFIHIEPWDLNVARFEGRLVPAAVMFEWGLPSEPWTFVVASDGTVYERFEGLVSADEVLAALASVR